MTLFYNSDSFYLKNVVYIDKNQFLGEEVDGVDADDATELLNYTKAFDYVSSYLKADAPIIEGLVREINKHLVNNVRGNRALPGKYRNIQNYVANSQTKEVIYTPPPPYKVPILMKDLIEWMRFEKQIPNVLLAGIAQFQLVHIHPFLDGNARTARLLSTLSLYKSGYDLKRLFTISEYYDRNRQDYYDAIQSVRNNNMDMTGWLEYFTLALEAQIQEVRSKGVLAMNLDVLSEKRKLSKRQKYLIDLGKYFSIKDYEEIYSSINRRSL